MKCIHFPDIYALLCPLIRRSICSLLSSQPAIVSIASTPLIAGAVVFAAAALVSLVMLSVDALTLLPRRMTLRAVRETREKTSTFSLLPHFSPHCFDASALYLIVVFIVPIVIGHRCQRVVAPAVFTLPPTSNIMLPLFLTRPIEPSGSTLLIVVLSFVAIPSSSVIVDDTRNHLLHISIFCKEG